MDLVTVAAYSSNPEAHLAKNLLEAEGIQAFLSADTAADMLHLTNDTKLQVSEADAVRAREVLAGAEHHELTRDAAREAEEHSKDAPDDTI